MQQVSHPSDGDPGYKILLVSGTHGFPSTQIRLARVREIARELVLRGATVHLLLLVEKPLTEIDEKQVGSLRQYCHELELIQHPANTSSIYRWCLQAEELVNSKLMRRPELPGRGRHCPGQLLRLLHSRYAPRNYAAVTVFGVHLARCFSCFNQWTVKLLDLPYMASDVHHSHKRYGRADVFSAFSDPQAELELASAADFVLVHSQRDAMLLRQAGHMRDLVYTPPFLEPTRDRFTVEAGSEHAQRPPRILCVGSETIANLDGLRWFRRHVFPRVLRAVPTCRLRLVGESARHIESGESVDRIGWVNRLDVEYARATVVALPLRMGSGLRRRAVEVLGAGKTLVTTSIGARGLPLSPLSDAIISDDPTVLAREILRAVTIDETRRMYERCGYAVAQREYQPVHAMASLCRVLGLPMAPRVRKPEPALV